MTRTTPGSDLTAMSAVDAAAAITRGELLPSELTEAYLARIEQLNPELNAFVTVTAQRAHDDAARADQELARGHRRGPLHGLPVGVKDLFDTAGITTAAGSRLLHGRVPDRDADVVAALRSAGTVLLGKTATHEFAWGGTTNNEHYGPTRNPHDPSRIPGGSSGGSAAAITAGLALITVGSDTAGSVRIPAALCGCVGFKPTYGTVSMAGVLPLAPELDHAGPITRTVADAVLVLDVLRGHATDLDRVRSLTSENVAGRQVARLRGWFEEIADDSARAGVDQTADMLRDAGVAVHDVDVGDLGPIVDDVFTVIGVAAEVYHRPAFERTPELFGEEAAGRLRLGPPDAALVDRARARLAAAAGLVEEVLREHDALLLATTPAPAPTIGASHVTVSGVEMPVEWMLTRLTSLFDVTGMPVVSVPAGVSPDGLPVAVQLVGHRGADDTIVPLAAAVERAWAGPLAVGR
ncbi:amidase [Phytoactinopolyspora limicola]|uniref:amidase n=1 Tax=Phytoactinopolyspora limicola TaxID=2715536 RepID=UPI00140A5F69|nr:amidase [Phytoactinopolyspora limicola]